MLDNYKYDEKNESNSTGDEIKVGYLLNFLIRNKIFISIITIAFFIIGSGYSLTKKRVWEGQFEIVLKTDDNNRPSLNFNNPLSGISSVSKSLKTQVGILESPSVLLPIFNYVNLEKGETNLNFKKWRNNQLDIKLKKGTSILNIAYRDTEKELIIPSLRKITDAYQDYSGKNKRNSQKRAKNFLEEQIIYFKNKSQQSLKDAQEYAIDQDLINISSVDYKDDAGTLLQSSNLILEEVRIEAVNSIRKIDLQIDKINQIGNDVKQLQYIGSTIPALVGEGLPQELKSLESQLKVKRAIYSEKDIEIKKLLEKRKFLVELLKERTIGILNAQRLVQTAKMESAMRPKEVLIKYKELIREAFRDENTLVNLENQLSLLLLEIEKDNETWELITQPTLLINPVAPNRKNTVFVATFLGFLIAALVSAYKEKKSGLIFEKNKIENLFQIPITESLKNSDITSENEKIIFLKNLFFSQFKGEVILYLIGDFNSEIYEKIKKLLVSDSGILDKENRENKARISIRKNINECISNDKNYILCDFKMIKLSDIEILKKRIRSLNLKFEGIIIFENYQS